MMSGIEEQEPEPEQFERIPNTLRTPNTYRNYGMKYSSGYEPPLIDSITDYLCDEPYPNRGLVVGFLLIVLSILTMVGLWIVHPALGALSFVFLVWIALYGGVLIMFSIWTIKDRK